MYIFSNFKLYFTQSFVHLSQLFINFFILSHVFCNFLILFYNNVLDNFITYLIL